MTNGSVRHSKRHNAHMAKGAFRRDDRDLAGAGHSQLGVDKALRARDVNRPTAEDLARAEQEVVIVRRNWKPPEER